MKLAQEFLTIKGRILFDITAKSAALHIPLRLFIAKQLNTLAHNIDHGVLVLVLFQETPT